MERNTLVNNKDSHERQLSSCEKEEIKLDVVEQNLLNNSGSCTRNCRISYVSSCKENFMARSFTVNTG